jgi:hypothetical protein
MLPTWRGLGLGTGLPRLARSLATGPAEAREALGHVGEAERRLDRNQVVQTSFILIHLVKQMIVSNIGRTERSS